MQNTFSDKLEDIGNKMPLTKSGKKVLSKMKKKYGKVRGKKIFYATIKKNPRKTKSWHRK